ncbi:rhodanese-like domain-containing protein [Secundilactobacillus kimchicus]|uniref:rhodanese-like domain-containing protein n=1 Tax=Secundilactobacillus kimchicus TaxID=528209 RepID=UPI003522C19B
MLMVAVSTMTVYTILLILLVVIYAGWRLVTLVRRNQAATLIDEQTFTEGMRKAQVVDVREKKDFNAGHILGARNIPYSTLRAYYKGLRKDVPIYLYDQGKEMSTRAAIFLHKQGYNNISILKTGYNRWDGKTKKAN